MPLNMILLYNKRFFAGRDIKAGEELLLCYEDGYFSDKMPCKCGEEVCRFKGKY